MNRFRIAISALPLLSFCQPANSAEQLTPITPAIICADLRGINICPSDAPAQIAAAAETDVNGAKMCVVSGVISPRTNFEVHLPVTGWTKG